jgi:hypothetical protein
MSSFKARVRRTFAQPRINRYTESGPQTKTVQIEPTHLKARRLFVSGGNLDEHISEPAKGRDGPRVSLIATSAASIWLARVSGGGVSPSAELPKTLRMSCAADSTVASEAVTADELVSTGCGFTVSSCWLALLRPASRIAIASDVV